MPQPGKPERRGNFHPRARRRDCPADTRHLDLALVASGAVREDIDGDLSPLFGVFCYGGPKTSCSHSSICIGSASGEGD